MLTANRTLTVGDLADMLSTLPRHTPVVVRACINDASGECRSDSCPLPCYHGQLTVEEVHTTVNCVELHARD